MVTSSRPRVVVTGASGFLGASAARVLAMRHDVELVAVSRQAVPRAARVARYHDTPAGDILLHFAEDSDRARVSSLGPAYAAGVQDTLRALLAKGFGRILYASSAVLYGDEAARPHDPKDPVHVADSYTRVKRDAEVAVLESGRGVVMRLANVYGAGMAAQNVVGTILGQVPGNGPVRVKTLTPVRDFLWVEDAARGAVALADAPNLRGVFNLGTGFGTSIEALALTVLDAAGQADRPVLAEERVSRSSILIVDIGGTTRACGWVPQMPLRDGLAALMRTRSVPQPS